MPKRNPGTHLTWKPEEGTVAEPLTTRALALLRHIKRAQMIMKRKKKYTVTDDKGEQHSFYVKSMRPPGPPIHKGPCVATEVLVDDPGILKRVFKGEKRRTRLVAGKGHRLASFDIAGNRQWHPRYGDIKQCIVKDCGYALRRVHAPKAGA